MAWFRGEVCAARVADVRASHMRARRQASHTPLQRHRQQYNRTAVARAAKASVAAARERGGKTAAESVAGWTPTRARAAPRSSAYARRTATALRLRNTRNLHPSAAPRSTAPRAKCSRPLAPRCRPSASSRARAGSATPDSAFQERIARALSGHRYPCQATTWSLMFTDCAVNGAGCALPCLSLLLLVDSNRVKTPYASPRF